MGDSQTSTSGTAVHRHSVTSSDGGSLRTDTTEVQILETSTYMTIQEYTTIQGIVYG
tara:strand:+ start:80 stop:250 length:171 start_codon:yes stop_codon:yes gene_type:complete